MQLTPQTAPPPGAPGTAVTAAPITVVWYAAADGAVVKQNPSWEAFTGQAVASYSGWGWLDAIHPDDRDAVRDLWKLGVGSRSFVELRYRLRRHDGEYRDMLAQGAPVHDGPLLREWVGFSVDTTNARNDHAALKASEERFRLLDRIGQGTRELNDAESIMAVTARLLCQHLGATRCAYADVDSDSDRFTIRSDWAADGVASSVGVYSLDLFGPQATFNLRQGRHLVVHDVDRQLGDEGGGRMFNAIGIKAIICAGLVKDYRLVAMMAVHQSQPRQWSDDEVATVAEVVERCWAHIERVRDRAVLREQDRRKDEFLATLAHELRNPLAPMKYAVSIARRFELPPPSANAIDILDRQVSLMARLIDDLLDMSRISRGLIDLKRESTALRPLVDRAVETARRVVEAGGHRLEVRVPDGLVLLADPDRVAQVIGNLVANAAKYTPESGLIEISARAQGGNAVLEIKDSGLGIPADQVGNLFQMFTQLPHTASRSQGGLGIGLALVKNLVELHGGSVGVLSEGAGKGSTFFVQLPLDLAPPMHQPRQLPQQRLPVTPVARRRVLVVEDNKDGLQTLVALLQSMGHEVTGVGNGIDAVAVASSFQPQLVLLDLGLTGMTGYQVAQALRQDPRHEGAVIVALTGWGAERDVARTKAAGFDHHLTKPVEPAVLERLLTGHQSGAP